MAKQVVMPQMGESVAEGTIVRWLKKVGDAVERDEPLFEISTDKVDAEIPSPSAGVLSEVKVKEGETVPINTVVAVIDETASKPVGRRGRSPQKRLRRSPHPSPLLKATAIRLGVRFVRAHRTRTCRTESIQCTDRTRRTSRACCTSCTCCTQRTQRVEAMVSGRSARVAVVAGRAKDRARASHRCAQHCGERRGRPRDEERHPRVHRRRLSHLRGGRRFHLRPRRFGGQVGEAGPAREHARCLRPIPRPRRALPK